MASETFTEWAERMSLALAPWQIEQAEQMLRALERGDRIVVVTNRRSRTVQLALRAYMNGEGMDVIPLEADL